MAGDCAEVLYLDQGHLTRSLGPRVTVAENTIHYIEIRALKLDQLVATARSDAKPHDVTRSYGGIKQLGERG
ncbi:hypothetical protein [Bosea sp. ASV33]|uniref:hypothetical protein n=1 Tax=Bosea sp. ASV33 TaxID=2795106 RepID=UPI0018ECE4AD|nr:hypothetical protein [Bosea sp. ASV33]